MTTRQKTNTYLLIFAVVIGAFLAIYLYHSKHDATTTVPTTSSVAAADPYTTVVSGNTLALMKNGTQVQTLTLGEDAVASMNLLDGDTEGIEPFITGQDVNFDGYPDVAMLTGIGYGGVNLFYQYYLFNPATEQLVADPVLTEIGNPVFDVTTKTITGDAKDAQDSYKTVYTFDGTKYSKGPTISDTTGAVQSDD